MALSPTSSHSTASGGLTKLVDTTLAAPATGIDTGAGGILGGYDVLQVWMLLRTDEAVSLSTVNIVLNNDGSAIYDQSYMRTRNVSGGNSSVTGSQWAAAIHGANGSATYPSSLFLTIPGYAGTTFWKAGTLLTATPDATSANNDNAAWMCGYRSTSAISRLAISVSPANLVVGSRLLIYGA